MEVDYISFGVRVAKAKFGYGVYTLKPFESKQMVGRIAGEARDDPHYQSDYCIELGDRLSLEPRAPFRFLNHSCDPNCSLIQFDEERAWGGGDSEIWVETLRAIEPGEQLTIDYGWPAESAIPCGCQSKCCRGWIVDEEQAHLLPPPHLDRLPAKDDAALAPLGQGLV